MPRPIRVCLIQHSTRSDNMGVGALTVSEVEILRRIARDLGREVEITVMDWKDPRKPYVEGPDIRILDLDRKAMLSPFGYFAQARRADLVIDIGGGDSFADIYGKKRIRLMFLLKILTHVAFTPLVMAPQTIGPFTDPRSIRLARATMRRCAIVATRDSMSTAYAAEIGVTRPIIEASDVALRLPYTAPAPRQSGPVRVGINVSGLLFGGGYTGKNEFGLKMDYPGLIRALIQHFLGHSDGCEVHLIPHVIVPEGRRQGEDDYRASEILAAEFPQTILAPAFDSPSEAKSYIADMDFFMGARMHSCVAAFSTGVPVVPMAYSRKFAGLFGSLGYDRTVDCTTESSDSLLAKIAAAYTHRDQLAAEAQTALTQGLTKLDRYETALKDLMSRVPA